MKFRKRIFIILLFIITNLLVAFFTQQYTAYVVEENFKDFKINLRTINVGPWVTNFKATTKTKKLNMFKTSFDVDVTIEGMCVWDDVKVDYIQKSERIEKIDGKNIAIIEFEPVYAHTKSPSEFNYGGKYKEKFTYTLNAYESGNLVYKLRCGDFEKTIYVSFDK